MTITFLGTGTSVGVPAIACDCEVCRSGDSRNKRTRASALVRVEGRNLLLDASIDLRQQLLRENVTTLQAVLLTHGHADHVFGLDDVRMFNFLQREPMPIYGNEDTLTAVRRTYWYVFDDGPTASSRPRMLLRRVEGTFDACGVPVTPLPIIHGSLSILGYRIGDLAYITDGSEIPGTTLELLEGLDVLVINALRRRAHPTHFTLDRALEQVERIRPRRAFLTHISHELEHAALSAELPTGVEPAYDGLHVEIRGEA